MFPDSETNNDCFGARYYSSGFGRFLTPDWSATPIPIPYAVKGNPQTLNLYSYVENNPITGTDPDGHAGSPYAGDGEGYYDCLASGSETCDKENSDKNKTESASQSSSNQSPAPTKNPYYTAAGVAFVGGEEFGPADWLVVGTLLTVGCIETHCLSSLLNENTNETEAPPPASTSETNKSATSPSPNGNEGDKKTPKKKTSTNQMDQQAKKGQAPKSVERVDSPRFPNEKPHVEFKDGSALNDDGTWKHGGRALTNAEKEWLQQNGWTIPR
jgi:RHS repeat-associated protein